MSYFCPHCISYPLEDYIWWVSGRKHTNWWCAICVEKYDWKQPNRLLVDQALCGNLINASKLLANQQDHQEDGEDGLIQHIVTNLGEGTRKGLTEGLREFIQVDNHRALEERHLNEGLGTFKVRRPKVPEGCLEVTDQLTLRAEEVGTWKSDINVDHMAKERWSPLLVDADWHAFCQALYRGIEREDWGELQDARSQQRSPVVRPLVPSSMLTSVHPSSPLMFSRSVLLALRIVAEEGRDGERFQVLVWGTNGRWVARVQCGRVRRKLDEDASSTASREGNVCNDALHVGLHGPGDKISLFLQDWEFAKVALSCHMAPGHAVPGNT